MFNLIICILICLQWGILPFKGGPAPQEEQKEKIRANYPQLIFLYLELMDEREVRYMFAKIGDFEVDFTTMIARYKDLKDAPQLYSCEGFPPRDVINDFLLLNREYEKFLVSILELYPENSTASLALSDTKYLYVIWDSVRDSVTPFYYVHIRKRALKTLKGHLDKIDPTWFYQRRLPNHVPLWAFTPVR